MKPDHPLVSLGWVTLPMAAGILLAYAYDHAITGVPRHTSIFVTALIGSASAGIIVAEVRSWWMRRKFEKRFTDAEKRLRDSGVHFE